MSDQPLRVAVLLSGTGRTLANLLEGSSGKLANLDIRAVISSRKNVRGLAIAKEHGIPSSVVRRGDFDSVETFSEALTEAIPIDEIDIVVMAGFLQLYRLPEALRHRVVNIHPSLLPLFGGRGYYGHHVHEAVLGSGMRVSGCTVHFVDNEYDTGPIIAQRTCHVRPDDNADSLASRVFSVECELLPEVLEWIRRGWVQMIDGVPHFAQQATPKSR